MPKLFAFIWCILALVMLAYFVFFAETQPFTLTIFGIVVCLAVIAETSKTLFNAPKHE
jgi:hypothetical protein